MIGPLILFGLFEGFQMRSFEIFEVRKRESCIDLEREKRVERYQRGLRGIKEGVCETKICGSSQWRSRLDCEPL